MGFTYGIFDLELLELDVVDCIHDIKPNLIPNPS
jgi:hypothetical protein